MVARCVRLYALLLVVYPTQFRPDGGPEMAQAFRDCCRDTSQRRGASGLLAGGLATLIDLSRGTCAGGGHAFAPHDKKGETFDDHRYD